MLGPESSSRSLATRAGCNALSALHCTGRIIRRERELEIPPDIGGECHTGRDNGHRSPEIVEIRQAWTWTRRWFRHLEISNAG